MIHKIYSDLATFHKLQLMPGLNILLADKNVEATDKQTRNGAGKTSLIELIHFIFGGSAGMDYIFRSAQLSPCQFGLDFDLSGEKVSVKRSGAEHGKIVVKSENMAGWPIQPMPDKSIGNLIIPNAKWRLVLGELVFGLPANKVEKHGKFAPTFRSLFSYFVRRQDSGGFASHISQSSRQLPWNQHVAISYLLGLDWSVSQEFQKLRDQEKVIKELKKSAKDGPLPGFKGSAASLRTQVTLAESKARQLKQQLDTFNVVPEYQSIEQEANTLTQEMNCKANENTTDRQLLDQLQGALESELEPETQNLENLYSEVSVILPEVVSKRLDEAVKFQHAIVENRKAHLRSEIERIQSRISQRDNEKAIFGRRRAELMKILKSGGALDQYMLLQKEYSKHQSNVETLKLQLATAEKLDSEQTRAEIERRQLQERLRQDFREQEDSLNEAIVLFEELSGALYEHEHAGNLTIGATENGPSFEVHIDAQRSRGITNMQIFCFDVMLAVIASRRNLSPGFLIHDSHLFDGVDERQVAKAMQIGKKYAEQYDFQYLVTMNSDVLPQDGFGANFNVHEHILPVKLDDTDHGGLFGVRFN